jgi:outer membrane protein assembly factor BamA
VLCLQENGYYKAVVKASTRQLADKDATHQFVITFHLDAGPQYRTGHFDFANNRVFSAEELRSMFDLASGDIFRPAKVRQGITRMRDAYIARGYPNFTPVPDANIDDSRNVINVAIDVEEGKRSP